MNTIICLHAGEDFSLESDLARFTFQPNQQQLPIPVTIFQDMVAELEERFTLSLSVPQDSALYGLGLQPSTDVFIEDDDGICQYMYDMTL